MLCPSRVFIGLLSLWLLTGTVVDAGPVVVDSRMTRAEAVLRSVSPDAPPAVLSRQALVTVHYPGFDGRLHEGQVVIDERLAPDIREVFRIARQSGFPIESVVPVAAFGWDDDRSMAANNTSGFNYRTVPGTRRLSRHAFGFAIDINPRRNPFIRNGKSMPPGARYDPSQPGTLTPDGPIVRAFRRLGWTWGGDWRTLKDYQHFQKIPR